MDRPEITTSTTSGTDPNRCVVHVKDTCQWAVDNDRVRRHEGLGEASVDPEAADGEHLLQALAQAVSRTRVGLVEQAGQVLGVPQAQSGSGWLKAFTSFASTHSFSLSGR
jgi:hypothetical protein